ncbi:hypothetical protein D3C72_1533080 [compost metagenome]
MRQPAHDDLVAADHLLAVDAKVLALLVRALGDDQPPGDQRRGVAGPAGLDRQARQVDIIAFPDHLLAGRAADALWCHIPHRFGEREQLARFAQSARRLRFLQG